MPRNTSVELLYLPLPEAVAAVGPAKAAIGGYKEIAYNVDEPVEPILFTLFIPKIAIATLNATTTFFIVDVTVVAKPQIIGESAFQGITAAGNTGSVTATRRIIPERDFTEEPGKQGRRQVTIEAESTGGTITIPANTAKTVAYLKIDGLARQ